MSAVGDRDTGAARPPLLLVGVLRLAFALLPLLTVGPPAAFAADACRFIEYFRNGAEWLDGAQPFGARLAIRDNRWSWASAHRGAIAACPSCSARDIAKGVLRIGLAPFLEPEEEKKMRDETGQQSASPIEFALEPRSIVAGLGAMTNYRPRGVTALTDITPIALIGMSGAARAVSIDSAGTAIHGVAVALGGRCFSVFGIFFREDNGAVALDDLRQVDAALTLQMYRPVFSPAQLAPRPGLMPRFDIPLGDARRQWEEERRR